MKNNPQVSDECRELIHSLIEDVDKCIMLDIRNSSVSNRDGLFDQLAVLEKVRERLNVRIG
jgi:hypothetical protein